MPGRLETRLAVVLLVWVMSTPGVRAQESGQQPQGAGNRAQAPAAPQSSDVPQSSSPPPGLQNPIGVAPQTESEQEGTETDTRPLAGAEAILPTLLGSERSYIIPSFSFWQGGDSNPELIYGRSGVSAAAVPVASLDLHLAGRKNTLDLDYGGGAFLFESNWANSAGFDNFQISDAYTAKRWNFFISDRGSYLPQSALGFGGIGFAGVFNNAQSLGLGSGSPLNSFYTPGQSLLTGYSGTLSNTAIAQFQYFLTPRTSASAVGAFGYQEYTQNGLTSSNDRFATLSVDHQLTPTETVNFAYTLMQIRYSGGSVALNDNLFRVGYAYRVTHRFTLNVTGGPELTYQAIQGVFGVKRRVSLSGQANLGYAARRGGVNLFFLHYLTPGSGVFQGAETSSATLSGNRELSRTWTGSASVGWSNNRALSTYALNPAFTEVGHLNYEYLNLRLSHQLGRSMRVFAVYDFQHQSSGAPIAAGSGRRLNNQIFGAGFEWHPRPFGI